MNKNKDYVVTSIDEFISAIKQIYDNENTELWYRGQRLSTRTLEPALYRSNLCYETEDNYGNMIMPRPKTYNFKGQEVRFPDQFKMLEKFKREVKKYNLAPALNMNEIEWLCFAQHCGMPTSLLDWSEDPMVALYFAISSIKLPIQDEEKDNEAIVFVLNPSIMNSYSTIWDTDNNGDIIDVKYPIPVTEKNYQIFVKHAIENNLPVCIKPHKLGYRMCRQSGNFMLYGTDVQPLDTRPAETVKKFLQKIHIPYSAVQEMVDVLNALNITKKSIYGDEERLDDIGKDARAMGVEQISKIVKQIKDEYQQRIAEIKSTN